MDKEIAYWKPRLLAIVQAQTEQEGAADGAHDREHLHRVWRNAQKLLKHYPEADALVVLAACYLHDLVNLPKDHPQRHLASQHAADCACEQLQAIGFPPEKRDGVRHAIEAHSFSAGIAPQTLEAKIVQDADRLDALGFVGMARLFYTAGRMGAKLAHATDPLAVHRVPDDHAYALDHIEIKLVRIAGTMQTPEGRQLCAARLERLRFFRAAFIEEWLEA